MPDERAPDVSALVAVTDHLRESVRSIARDASDARGRNVGLESELALARQNEIDHAAKADAAENAAAALRSVVAELQTEVARLAAESSSRAATADALRADLDDATSELDRVRRSLETSRDELGFERRRVRQFQRHLKALEESASWRMTRPLRALSGLRRR